MSVEDPKRKELTQGIPPTPVTHTLVWLDGVAENVAQEGGPIDTADREVTREALLRPTVRAIARSGAIDDQQQAQLQQAVFDFIKAHFHPRGKLVVYGYSAGGMNALDLCRRIQKDIPRFDWAAKKLTQEQSDATGAVRVDLLVTVDAAARKKTPKIDRSVAECVRLSHNFYQIYGSLNGSVGAEHTAAAPTKTEAKNHNQTAAMNAQTFPKVRVWDQDLPFTSEDLGMMGSPETVALLKKQFHARMQAFVFPDTKKLLLDALKP